MEIINHTRRILLFCAIPVVIILIIESLVYFSSQGLNALQVVLCSLENTCMAFVARPTVSAFYAFRAVNDSYSVFEKIMTTLYGAMVILAPILTTTTILSGFEAYILEFRNSVFKSGKDKLYVIGDTSMARSIALQYADDYQVHYLMPSQTSSKLRLVPLRKKVLAYTVDYDSVCSYLEKGSLENVASVVFSFNNWFENYKAVADTIEYLLQNTRKPGFPVYIVDAPSLYQDVFGDIYKGFCKKYARDESALQVQFINASEVNVKNFFKDPQLTVQPDNVHHIMILGLGNYGKAVFQELLPYMYANGLNGTVEVIDRNIDQKVNDITYTASTLENVDLMDFTQAAENALISAYLTTPAGRITLNYYKADLGGLDFSRIIQSIFSGGKLTEVFFCVDDVATSFHVYRILSFYLSGEANAKIYFRAGNALGSTYEGIEMNSDQFCRLPDGIPKVELRE